jgi:hypothetical protein
VAKEASRRNVADDKEALNIPIAYNCKGWRHTTNEQGEYTGINLRL